MQEVETHQKIRNCTEKMGFCNFCTVFTPWTVSDKKFKAKNEFSDIKNLNNDTPHDHMHQNEKKSKTGHFG